MYYRPSAFYFWPLLLVLCACTGQTDAVSQHINACLLVTEGEVETALGAPVSAAEKRSDTQCLYRAKHDSEEALAVDINPEPGKDQKTLFSSELVKRDATLIADVGDAAFVFPSPSAGVQLTFLKDDALVDLTITSSRQASGSHPLEAVIKLGKTAARRLAQQLAQGVGQGPSGDTTNPSTAWAGDWYGCHLIGALNTKGHLVLTPSGHWALTAGTVMPGILFAEKGHWRMDSLQDLLHGTYQVTGSDTFSTTGILSLRWGKISKDHGPIRFDPTLYRSLTGVPHKVTVRRLPPVEPALLGMWEGSAKYLNRREDFVWLITSNNVSEFYKAVRWSGVMQRDGDRFRLATMPAGATSFHLKTIKGDTLELTTADGSTSHWGRKEKELANC